jgi:hypothetical protein
LALTPALALTPNPFSRRRQERGLLPRVQSVLPSPRSEGRRGGDEGSLPSHLVTLVTGHIHVAALEWKDSVFLGEEAVPPDAAVVDPEQVE